MAEPLLDIAGLDAGYGPAQVLFGVSLRLAPGEVVALLGRNGAGKSTLIKAVMGLVAPRGGAVRFAGHEIAGQPAWRVARAGLGYVPEERRVFPDLTVAENLAVGRRPAREGLPEWTPERLFALFPPLAPLSRRAAGSLSGGEQQMLAIGRAMMSKPRLLLLDEPSLGLAPLIVRQIFSAIRDLNEKEGLTVLLVEQNANQALRLAHRGYVLVNGRITLRGTGRDLLAMPEVRDAYLGGGH